MDMKTKRRILVILIVLVVLILIGYSYSGFKKSHTFTLSDEVTASSNLKSEEIQPILGNVRVWGTQDTDVWLTDVEDQEVRYQIGYITPGMSATIKLERGRWYIVHGAGEITVQMVNVRIQ